MDRKDIKELYYITPIANIPSILEHGILSHNLSLKIDHHSVAMPEIQAKRKDKQIPNAGKLHDYANFYFDAHNPMLSKRRNLNNEICTLQINPAILDLPEIIIADQNAASGYVRFYNVTDGLAALNKDEIFAKSWLHDNPIEYYRHSAVKCAEVLVPNKVEPKYILGAYVANQTALAAFNKLKIELTVCIKNDIFF